MQIQPTLNGIDTIPREVAHEYSTLDAFKNDLSKKITNLQFEFYPDNRGFLRYASGSVYPFVWRAEGDGSYWLMEGDGESTLVAHVGHGFKMTSDRTATCKYQVKWNEDSAPRTPILLEKIWE